MLKLGMLSMVLVFATSGCEDSSRGEDLPGVPGKADGPTDAPGQAGQSQLCEVGANALELDDSDFGDEGPYEVATRDLTFIDESRSTAENGWYWGSDRRKLKTTIYYPGEPSWFFDDPVSAEGSFPLVVYSHGFSSGREEAKALATHLASHGYIVIAPTFPLTNMLAPGGPSILDVVNQPGDVSFLIDQMLAKSLLASDDFYGAIDDERIAAVGLSMGAMTTSLVSYHPRLGDPRIRAAATLAGPSSLFGPTFYQFDPKPLLLIHGDIDAFIDYELNARTALDRAAPNANLVTIIGGSHTGFAPLEPELIIDIVGAIVAPEGAHPDNPDGLGCGFIGSNIEDQANGTDSSFIDQLGDESDGIIVPTDPTAEPLPCTDGKVELPAIESAVQVAATQRAVLSFLHAYFGGDETTRESSCLYLNEGLGQADELVTE